MRSHRWPVRATTALFLVLIASGAACQSRAPLPGTTSRSAEHAMTDLVAQVRQKDPAATATAQALGPSAAATLIPLTRDPDSEVREIALLCLAETGGNGAVAAMMGALNDSAPMTRSAALKGLQRQGKAQDVPALIAAMPTTENADFRGFIALLVGQLGSKSDIPALQHACIARAESAEEGCVTALAQLGDPAAREQFSHRLGSAQGQELARLLESADRISAPWLVPALVPLLSDTTPVKWIGVDGLPGPESLRAADVAVNLLAAITGRQFGFPLAPNVNYTEQQRAKVRSEVAR